MSTLTSVRVENLLGRFTHDVPFPSDDRFVILHGANGVGKTHLLQLVEAVLSYKFWELYEIPFTALELGFSGGERLTVNKWSSGEGAVGKRANDKPSFSGQEISLSASSGAGILAVWKSKEEDGSDKVENAIRSILELRPGVERYGTDAWYHYYSDRVLSTSDLISSSNSPSSAITGERMSAFLDLPSAISNLVESNPVKFVQTQRLLSLREDVDRRGPRGTTVRRESTVVEFSNDIVAIISERLAENSRKSSQLDRSFPLRVLARTKSSNSPVPTDPRIRKEKQEELLKRYTRQTELRNRLSDVSLLDPDFEVPLDGEIPLAGGMELDDTELRVLETYLDDADEKLGTFKVTLDRITLLRDIINSRFLYKTLNIDSSNGFVFRTPENEVISPDRLSSGEQHEIVLLYELLFRTEARSLVLIDEPEISLHVGWQRQFINDLNRVSELSELRFIVATHSPQVIDRWYSKAIDLAPARDGEA